MRKGIKLIRAWFHRRSEIKNLEWKMSRVTHSSDLMRIHDKYRNIKRLTLREYAEEYVR